MSNTPLIALVDLYEQASAASLDLQLALHKASDRITQCKEQMAARSRMISEPDPEVHEVLEDALNILEAAINHEDRWKSAGVIPILRVLQSRIRQVLNKSTKAGEGGSIQ